MKKVIITIMIFVCGLCFCGSTADGALITIEIEAVVDYVGDSGNYLNGQINPGDIITGTYTYDSATQDSNPSSPSIGSYQHDTSPCGIFLSVGGFEFRTDPADVYFLVEIANDHPWFEPDINKDNYLLRSYSNLPLSNGTSVEHISWQLNDPTGSALSSDALPTAPPTLDQWEANILRLLGDRTFSIDAHVTSVIPEPATYYVDGTNGNDDWDGLAEIWDGQHGPKRTIQSAIDATYNNDEIIVSVGTYYENINFGGKNIILRSTDPTNQSVVRRTIIDGGMNGSVVTFSGEESPDCVLSGLTITNGSGFGETYGGGIFGGYSNTTGAGTLATIQYNIISANRVVAHCFPCSTFGGGLCNCDGTIQYNIISGNLALGGEGNGVGGGLYSCDGVIQNNIITGNWAFGWNSRGGGIYCEGGGVTIRNCTISGNLAAYGGGIYNRVRFGSGGSCDNSSTITNCILWGNEAPNGKEIYWDDDAGDILVSYSDVQGGWEGQGNIDADPCFVEAGFWDANGTLDIWYDDFWVEGDYHLRPESLCIDAGDPCYVPSPNETDLDGFARVLGGRIDMGAYEFSYIESRLWVFPQVINRHSRMKRIMAWVHLPKDITKEQIDADWPVLLYYPDAIEPIEPTRQYVLQHGQSSHKRTYVLAYYNKAELMAAVPDNGNVDLEVVGSLKSGQYFYGSDTVRIIGPRWRRWFRR